jgi:nucleotidyltransferase substrate binding protein (TIGR01987 family)
MTTQDIRWKQRFDNFDRAVDLLREPILKGVDSLSDLEQEGTIQRFEVALELAWKTLKDYLEYGGAVIDPITPRAVIKEAFAAGIIPDGQIWIDMLDDRNRLSHTYDQGTFRETVRAVHNRYLPAFEELRAWLKEHIGE